MTAKPDCGMCGGTGLIAQAFFDRCEVDGIYCLPVGTRCYCTVTVAEIEAALPDVIMDILTRSDGPTIAEHIARQAHKDQVDRAGKPYIEHVERTVANLLRRWPGATDDEIATAWLHDVIEDTPWTAVRLREAGISPTAVAFVEEVTRPENVTYLTWIRNLAASGSLSAVKVKIADNEDNSAADRVAAIPEGQSLLEKRYRPARAMLEARLSASP